MRGRCPDRCRGCGRRGSQRPGFGVFPARASTVAEINGPARSGGGWAPPALTALRPVAPGRWNAAGLRPRPASAGRVASCRNTLAGWRRQAGVTQEQQCGHAGAERRCRARAEGARGGPLRVPGAPQLAAGRRLWAGAGRRGVLRVCVLGGCSGPSRAPHGARGRADSRLRGEGSERKPVLRVRSGDPAGDPGGPKHSTTC